MKNTYFRKLLFLLVPLLVCSHADATTIQNYVEGSSRLGTLPADPLPFPGETSLNADLDSSFSTNVGIFGGTTGFAAYGGIWFIFLDFP